MAAAPKAPNTSPPPIAAAAPSEVSAAASEVGDASSPPVVVDGAEAPVEAAASEVMGTGAPKRVALIPVAFLQSDGIEGATPDTKLTGAH